MGIKTGVTFLDVPADAFAHAKRFGAKRNRSGNWYVTGEIPHELLNYLPKRPNSKFYEFVPSCPICGASMRKHMYRDGKLLWRCYKRFQSRCQGAIDYLDYLDKIAPTAKIGDLLARDEGQGQTATPTPGDSQAQPTVLNPLKRRWEQIVNEALVTLGSRRQVMAWLQQPKLALGNKSPMETLGTEDGCNAVMKLLQALWD